MSTSIEERIEKLLDQLTSPSITAADVELIEKKLVILKSQQE